ncbi:hypothetical protein [Desulfovibrio piger]|uniref:Uncharacterized protein n=1 Tax=Desulfovibrio piger ATCC 29098 TaxID=411464 RepID=B6WT93_9BACT|nr:hypothetical protein [Desulfovibrio piger]EEB33783.1 hypothetical protein DESPIG_01298 [Desulfovibrio piger ATCC 29098]
MEKKFLFLQQCQYESTLSEKICSRKQLTAYDEDLVVYRALRTKDICIGNFTPQLANSADNRQKIKNDPCSYCGLSIFLDKCEFKHFIFSAHLKRRFPYYAQGIINQFKDGPIEKKPTPVHVTWHPYSNVIFSELFSLPGDDA